jgi:hypothetical protein
MMSEWIRVDVSLPEEVGRYLAYHYYMDFIVVVYWDGKSWERGYNITHWMALPEKPKDWAQVALATGSLIELEGK